MEEKQTLTNEQLESEIRSLKAKKVLVDILSYCSLATMAILWFISEKKSLIALGFVFMIVTVVFFVMSSDCGNKIKKLLSDNIISSVLKEALGDTVEYNPGGRVEPGYMVFPFSHNMASGSDHIKAVYKGLNIELSDIELIEETESTNEDGVTEKNSVTHFKGQWLICDFGKELSGEVRLSANTKTLRKQNKNSNIEMENEEFNKRFLVIAGNPEEAYYILTPHMMEYILSMAEKSGGEVYMSFLRDGKMQIAVRTDRDFFELGKSKVNVEKLREKFIGELSWFTDIIDTLRVEDSIYKKETNV
ncbi:MAG: DUF3137 domain-containing protein [Eubacteriales bacterium]